MTTAIEYALMAGDSYISSRPEINQFPLPEGWAKVVNPDSYFNDPSSGFEAISFTNGTEIVISYAGTYDKDYFGDLLANAGLATGFGSTQLFHAAEYYLQIKAANRGATITLTGHSLGGGLAALVGVFFGVQAQTFDQAPFAETALFGASELRTYLLGKHLYSNDDLLPLSSYIAQKDAFGAPANFIPNAGLVTNSNVQGEFLSSAPWTLFNRIGTLAETISATSLNVSGFDMHAQALLVAFLQSRKTAATGKALNEATVKLPDFLQMIFDPKLFAYRTDDASNRNLLDHLVRHEVGIQDSFVADAMVTRFTSDLWKLAQDGGLTMTDGNPLDTQLNEVSKTLMAFAMQKHYEETVTSTGYSKELFTDLSIAGEGSNGIQFDMADVSSKFATALDNNDRLNLADAKGFDLYFKNYLQSLNNFNDEERELIQSMLPAVRDWYVQAGAGGMVATDILNRGSFMLGGSGADTLTGGTAADLLVGNAGDDILAGGAGADALLGGTDDDSLEGGSGNDSLLGGMDNDSYVFSGDFVLDTVQGSDGLGSILVDGETLAGGAHYGDARVHRDDSGHLYVNVGAGRLVINGNRGNATNNSDWRVAA